MSKSDVKKDLGQVFKKFIKIILLSSVFAIQDLKAQESSKIVEQNLTDKTQEVAADKNNDSKKTDQIPNSDTGTKSNEPKTESSTESTEKYQESPLLQKARNGIVDTLLGKNTKKSLMFDDQEYDNLERAVDSLKNNEVYVPEDGENPELTPEEAKKKAEEAENLKKSQEVEVQENEKSYIYLASIIYFNSKDWIVWINDKKITSKTNDPKKELYVEKISRSSAKVLWKLSLSKWKIISGKKEEFAPKTNNENQIETRFELKPNQTFVLSSNKILEGKTLVNLQKKKDEESESDAKPKK